jgi:hypothetical protein
MFSSKSVLSGDTGPGKVIRWPRKAEMPAEIRVGGRGPKMSSPVAKGEGHCSCPFQQHLLSSSCRLRVMLGFM